MEFQERSLLGTLEMSIEGIIRRCRLITKLLKVNADHSKHLGKEKKHVVKKDYINKSLVQGE